MTNNISLKFDADEMHILIQSLDTLCDKIRIDLEDEMVNDKDSVDETKEYLEEIKNLLRKVGMKEINKVDIDLIEDANTEATRIVETFNDGMFSDTLTDTEKDKLQKDIFDALLMAAENTKN